MIGSLYFLNRRDHGPFNLGKFLGANSSPDVNAIVEGTVAALSCSLTDLRHSVRRPGDDQYELGPLAAKPLIWIDDDHLVVPSPAHIPIATSSTALYLRLIREDANARHVNELRWWASASRSTCMNTRRLD